MTDFYSTMAAAIAALDARTALLGTGAKLRIYAGAVPADADAPLGGATLISEHDFSDPAFQPAADDAAGAALAAANAISAETAIAGGEPTFYRAETSVGGAVAQGDVTDAAGNGPGGTPNPNGLGDLIVEPLNVVVGATLTPSALNWRQPVTPS